MLTCNWEAYSALEAAGSSRRVYPAGARALRLPCLGSVSTNLIVEALRQGADGVLLLACPKEQCHYETGSALAERTFGETVELLEAAGLSADRLEFHQAPFGDGEQVARVLLAFERRLGAAGERASESEVGGH